MADRQQFLVTKPAGKPLLTPHDISRSLFSTEPVGVLGVTVTEVTSDDTSPATSLLPWRVKHNGVTVAAAEKPLVAAQILLDLAEDPSDNWLVTFEMDAI